MKIARFIQNNTQILYDGLYPDLRKEFNVSIDDLEITFTISEIEDNSFQNLKFQEEDLKIIVKEGCLKNSPPDYYLNFMSKEEFENVKLNTQYYLSEHHLGLNYLIKDNFLLLFTYGEKQPLRWILILEGIWKLKV
jgi:hypothetical protein